jgi:putative aldouronate transport system substrate-binding protein
MKSLRIITSIIAVSIIASSFTGCSASNKTQSTNVDTDGSKEKLTITVLENVGGVAMPEDEDDFVKTGIDKALNIDLQLQLPGGNDYTVALNTRIASGDMPDIFSVPSRQYLSQYVANGVILDLTKYKDKLSETFKLIGEESVKKGEIDNKLYAISKAKAGNANSLLLRKDWLDKLGLKMPTTPDELLAVAKAFAENDPDGNGKKDTYGFSGSGFGGFTPLFAPYGVTPKENFLVKDGKLTCTLYEDGYKDAIAEINKFVTAGALDPDFLINTGSNVTDKAVQGKVGIIWSTWANMLKDDQVANEKAVNPNATWVQVDALTGPAGKYVETVDISNSPAIYSIPKSLEKNPAKLQRVFDLLNYVSSEEGNRLVDFGVEGRHYNVTDGKVVSTPLMGKECGYTWAYQFTGRDEIPYLSAKFVNQAKAIEYANNLPRITILTGFFDIPTEVNKADVEKYIESEVAKFIYGKRSISEFDTFSDTLNNTYGLKTYFDSAVEQAKIMGYTK